MEDVSAIFRLEVGGLLGPEHREGSVYVVGLCRGQEMLEEGVWVAEEMGFGIQGALVLMDVGYFRVLVSGM